MYSILTELHNIGLFFEAILIVACVTGLILVPFVVLGYELTTKRRGPWL